MRARTVLLVLLGVMLGAQGPARAEDAFEALADRCRPARWSRLERGVRQAAVRDLGDLADVRAFDRLIALQRAQQRITDEVTDRWADREKAWSNKTVRLERPIEKRRRAAYYGGERPTVGGEVEQWLGSTAVKGAMHAAKRRIENLYRIVRAERVLLGQMTTAAARVLANLDEEARAGALPRVMKSVDRLRAPCRAASIRRLAVLADPLLEPWLVSRANDREQPVAAAALEALGQIKTRGAVDTLVERLTHRHWQMRAGAIRGLASARDARAVDPMLAQAAKERGVLIEHYQRAFEQLFGGRYATNSSAWATWWKENREVVGAAWKAGRPVAEGVGQPPAAPTGSTSFYGIHTTSRHIVFVVDMSSSMKSSRSRKEARFLTAKKQLAQAIATLHADVEDDAGPGSFNIVVYGTYVDVYKKDGMVLATPAAKKKALKWVEKTCIPVGMTNSFDALAAAFEVAAKANARHAGRSAADTIYFMTDAGAPNRGRFFAIPMIVEGAVELNRGLYLTIHTVGVGSSVNPKMLKDLARQSGGQTIVR